MLDIGSDDTRLVARVSGDTHVPLEVGPPELDLVLRFRAHALMQAIEVEVWELPAAELGTFLAGIPAPLGLGKVTLADGRQETGFICEPSGIEGATDISHFGSWRRYLENR
ncbi:hypothetical protein [Parazoarcus communis]|uniref:allophanate hydrolase-related protein n=1 Tax=Parazoarcus communis TaxID=41977 RepID=UPI001F183959|nr:hypothetical protein [Parazoarcus communis]